MKSIAYREGYKYQLAKEYHIQIDTDGTEALSDFIYLNKSGLLIIRKGYAWDGPSGPTFDTATFMRGSLVHDALYQLIREGKLDERYRKYADYLLKELCLQDGMWKIRAWYVFCGVSKHAVFAADPKNKKKIKVAPK